MVSGGKLVVSDTSGLLGRLVGGAGPGHFPVFCGSTVVTILKDTVKGGKRIVTAPHGYVRHAVTGVDQKQLGICHSSFLKVLIVGSTGKILEKSDEVRLGKAGDGYHGVQRKILGTVFVDVFAYTEKCIYIALLMLML